MRHRLTCRCGYAGGFGRILVWRTTVFRFGTAIRPKQIAIDRVVNVNDAVDFNWCVEDLFGLVEGLAILAAHARATALGMPGVRIVVLPSPLAPRTIPEVQQMARDFAPEIVALLTGK